MEEHKQYHKRLHLAYSDLLDSKSYAELLLKKSKEKFGFDERTIFKAILTSFVVSYGRALTRSNTEEKKYDAIVSMKFKKFIKATSMHLLPEEQKQYELLLSERNKIFSHSDARSHDLRQCKMMDTVTVGYLGNNVLYGYEAPESVLKGMIQSFYDAPGFLQEDGTRSAFQEELAEILISVGGEYWYRDKYAVRIGYFHEHIYKGNRKYLTLGLGGKWGIMTAGLAYLIPTNGQESPLANTLRIMLSFEI